MGDLPFDSGELTNEALDRCPDIIKTWHEYTKAVIAVLDEWGFLLVVEPKEEQK